MVPRALRRVKARGPIPRRPDGARRASLYAEGGFKGAGEAGTAGAPGAVLNAVNDALAPLGARVTVQPITPEIVLGALGKL